MEPNRKKIIIYDTSYTLVMASIFIPLLNYYLRINDNLKKTTTSICLLVIIIFGIVELVSMLITLCHHLLNYNKAAIIEMKHCAFSFHLLCLAVIYSMMIVICNEIFTNTAILYRYDSNIRGYLIFIISSTLFSWFIATWIVFMLFIISLFQSQEPKPTIEMTVV